jgi:dTDP-4-amino-4,6-dideoxygalactose transaminase
MGASWDGKKSGIFGEVACFSMQTYKHLNSDEGGFLISRNPELMARAIMHSGSYMLYSHHAAAPAPEVFADISYDTPNYSGRMDNLRAAILRPQLANLDNQCLRWNRRYRILEATFKPCKAINIPTRPDKEQFVASSIQFSLSNFNQEQILKAVAICAERGVILKWFGAAQPDGYTSRYDSWRYIEQMPHLPMTEHKLSSLITSAIGCDQCLIINDIDRGFNDGSVNRAIISKTKYAFLICTGNCTIGIGDIFKRHTTRFQTNRRCPCLMNLFNA